MEITKTLHVTTKQEWRAWLKKNYNKEPVIWLVFYKKASGKPRLSYIDALNEALCFGWIDSTAKRIDDEKYCQKFTPRRKGSPLSQMNKERVRLLIAEKKMTQAGLDAIAHAFNAETDVPHDFIIPKDILNALKSNKDAWKNFQKFPEYYQRLRVAYIGMRKDNPELYEKRLSHFIKMTAQNKMFGMLK